MTAYLELAQGAFLLTTATIFVIWLIGGRDKDWLFNLGNALAFATVALFIARSFVGP
jgi:hypothetical protein